MALVADDDELIRTFGHYDTASDADIVEAIEDSTFGLLRDTTWNDDPDYGLKLFHPSGHKVVPETILEADHLLPKELSRCSSLAFVTFRVLLLAATIYIFVQARISSGKL